MNNVEELKKVLVEKNCSLVVKYENNEIKEYYNNGIKDIISILSSDKKALNNSVVADKVIGKVAASILIVAGVKELYADTISKFAIQILDDSDISYEYKKVVEYVQNRDKTGMCPMESRFKQEKDINKIYNEFINKE